MPSAIQSLPDQRFLDVNERLVQVTGLSREALLGKTPSELNLWENSATAAEWYAALARNESIREQPSRR